MRFLRDASLAAGALTTSDACTAFVQPVTVASGSSYLALIETCVVSE